MDEQDLIKSLRAGSQEAFSELLRLYSARVLNTCYRFVLNRQDAEDISQDVFIEVYQSIKTFKGKSKLSTWIYRIAASKSLDHLKSKKRKKRFAFLQSLFGAEGIIPIADAPHFEHPGVILENKEYSKVLFYALSKLPESQQTAFNLNKIEGLSYLEVSEVMKVSVSSVESLLFRANQNLRKLLENYYKKI